MSNIPLPGENPHVSAGLEISNFRRMAAVLVGVGVISAAACVDQSQQSQPAQAAEQSELPHTPADSLSKDLADRAALTEEITKGTTEVDDLRDMLRKSDETNLSVRKLQTRLVDLEDVSYALYEDLETATPLLADVVDPTLKKQAEDVLANRAIDKVISALGYKTPQQTLDAVAELPDSLQTRAHIRFQDKLAERAAQIVSFDFLGAQEISGYITDPTVKGKITHAIELADRLDKFFDNYNYDYDMDDYYSLQNQLLIAQNDLQSSAAEALSPETNLDSTDILLDRSDTEDELARQTTIDVRAHNSMKASNYDGKALPPLKNPKAHIDLTHVESKKEFIDGVNGETYQEFGQIYIEQGKIKFKLQDGIKLSKRSREAMLDVVAHVQPLLDAAFASGDLSVVRWVLSNDYDPYYSSVSHETVMVLPNDKSTTVDQLASGLVHETIHSLTRSAYKMEQVTIDEANAISAACTAVKDATFNTVEASLSVYPELLQGVLRQAQPKHKAIIQTIITAVENGSFEKLMLNPSAEYGDDSEYAAVLNNCDDLTFANALVIAAGVTDVDISNGALDYLFETQEYADFADQWDMTLSYGSLYELMNESNFAETDYIFKEYLGHSQDNAAEMIASFVDAVLSYAPQLNDVLYVEMDQEGRTATIQAIRTSIDLIIARHPTLQGLLSAAEADILTPNTELQK